MKTLVVYFSRKGYVKKLAEEEAARMGADILALQTSERIGGFLGFWWCGRFGMHRWTMPLRPYTCALTQYDRVLVCSPVWVFNVSAPVREFLSRSAGKIRAVDYMLVHFSGPMRYKQTVACMDRLLGVQHDRLISVCCMWGRMIKKRIITESVGK